MKIVINGRAGSGKDVVADYLVSKYNFTKLSFASGIYDLAISLFDMKVKNRMLLQRIGESMRDIDEDVWINLLLKNESKIDGNVVISDCRRENEYLKTVERGYIPIRIIAPEDIRVKRIEARDGVKPNKSLLENDSETGADNMEYDFEIVNDSSLDELYRKIDNIIKIIKRGLNSEY